MSILLMVFVLVFSGSLYANDDGQIGEISAKVISYEKPFRRGSSELVGYLSLVVYFSEEKTLRHKPTYQIMYELVDERGEVYLGVEKFKNPNPCKLGYTGVEKVLDCDGPTYIELPLKIRTQRLPLRKKDYVQDGDWWIKKGSNFPNFSADEYKVSTLKIYDQYTQELVQEFSN